MHVAGVDGCPGGWIAALVTVSDRRRVEWRLLAAAGGLRDLGARVAIDIPIGLPDGDAPRAADGAARRRLPGRASCVFSTPVRAVLGAADYPEACAVSRAASGRALSRQSWFISPKIADVDAAVTHLDDGIVTEAHPEVSFATMAGGRPAPPKKTAAGQAERVRLLTAWLGLDIPELLRQVPRPARADDALDALACAWTAERWLRGRHETLGDGARDARGLPMRILV